jgi:Sulfotransferase family
MIRRKIVAISGSGRTGSTLLSLLLSQHRDIFNLGQLRDLWSAWLVDAPCSCGHALTSCPVYSTAIPAVFGAPAADGLQEIRRSMKAFFADAARIHDWSAAGATDAVAQQHAGFIARLGAMLDALQAATGAPVLIDASKSPEMALALSLTAGTDAYVLNLVRDPRAIAVSWSKRRGQVSAGWEFSRIWAQRQRQLARWSKALDGRFMQVRYEDFAADARASVAQIQAWAALAETPGVFGSHDRAVISWDGQHLYPPANERVLSERATAVTIAPSDEWRDKSHRLQHALALLATHPDGARYVRESAS